MGHFVLYLLRSLEADVKNQSAWKLGFGLHRPSREHRGSKCMVASHLWGGEEGGFRLLVLPRTDFKTRFKSLIWGDSHLLNFNQELKAKK